MRQVSTADAEAAVQNYGFMGSAETSAKTGLNVEMAFREIARILLERRLQGGSGRKRSVVQLRVNGRKPSKCC